MSPLPDRKRPNLIPPARALAKSLAHIALATAWRGLHPGAREGFHECRAPRPIRRLSVRADDGCRAPLFVLQPAAGTPGEPVLLIHGLTLGPQAARYGRGPTLASHLASAGFTVYCMAHRGDRDASTSPGASLAIDDIAFRDVPAAMTAAALDSGYARVHVVGHGLGGQVALMAATRHPMASTTTLAAPIRFARHRARTLRMHRVIAQLPAHWALPLPLLTRISSPVLDEHSTLADRVQPGSTAPDRLRGALHHTGEAPNMAMLRQLATWHTENTLTDARGAVDLVQALGHARWPLHMVHAPGDALGAPESPDDLTRAWGGTVSRSDCAQHLGRLDVLLGRDAQQTVWAPMSAWLDAHRRLAW